METAVLVGDQGVLNQLGIREAVIRIPEVSLKLKEFQISVDQLAQRPVDLMMMMSFDDNTYQKLGGLKTIICAAVQCGLFERYIKKNGLPKYMVGGIGLVQVVSLFTGMTSVSEFLRPLVLAQTASPTAFESSGMFTKPGYEVVMLTPQLEGSLKIEPVDVMAGSVPEVVQFLIEEKDVRRLVNLGPGDRVINSHTIDPMYEHVQVTETIEMDPMLAWFWTPQLRDSTVVV